jgi:Family of unknown function (DUF6252)
MKKLLSIITLLVLFSSCQDEVKFNNPSFQAYRDDVLFRAIQVTATKSASGSIRIEALAQDETFVLNIANSVTGTYYIASINNNNWATYTSNFNETNVDYFTRDGFEPITNIANSILVAGTGYTNANAATTTNTGSGAGMTVKTTTDADGKITSIKINNPGGNYQAGDVITVNGGDGNAKFRILSEIKLTNNGDGTISGSFKFNAKNVFNNPSGGELVNVQYGAFYNLPVSNQ